MSFLLRFSRQFGLRYSMDLKTRAPLAWPSACTSGVWLSIVVLVMTCRPGFAEWVPIEKKYQSPGLQTVYVDPSTFSKENNLATLNVLIDWKWMQGNRSPTRFYSTQVTKQFDCTKKLFRSLAATDFYGHMGTGKPVGGGGFTSQGHWVRVEPESLNQGLWELACEKEALHQPN